MVGSCSLAWKLSRLALFAGMVAAIAMPSIAIARGQSPTSPQPIPPAASQPVPSAPQPVPALQGPPPATVRREEPAAPQAPETVAGDRAALKSLWAGGRYRITSGDVIEFNFPYVPEFNQTVNVQPDGYISLRGIPDVPAAGRTVPELRSEVLGAYEQILRDPVVTLVLKEFEKPYFIVGGDVAKPGKYELRGATTVTQALAVAGGKAASGKLSDVVLFRRWGNDLVDVKRINVKQMYAKRDLSEDPILRPGDTIFVPRSTFSKIAPFIPKPSMGFFLNPLNW